MGFERQQSLFVFKADARCKDGAQSNHENCFLFLASAFYFLRTGQSGYVRRGESFATVPRVANRPDWKQSWASPSYLGSIGISSAATFAIIIHYILYKMDIVHKLTCQKANHRMIDYVTTR